MATLLTVSTYRPVKRKLKLPEATLSESRGVRCLHLDTPWIQGAMRVSKPLKLELEYIQRMMSWLLLRDLSALPDTRCVQLGLGAAAITKHCHAVLRVASTTAVEINPTVVGVCRNWFNLPDNDERLQVLQLDAAKYVANADHAASADALCVDLYDQEAASPVLDDEAFYRDCWRLLDDGGVMSVNLFGRDASFAVSSARIAAAFGPGRTAMLKPTREGNTVVLAWKGFDLPSREILAERAETLQNRFELPAGKWLKLLSTFTPRPTT